MYNQLPGYLPIKTTRPTGWLLILALVCAAAFAVRYSGLKLNNDFETDAKPSVALALPAAEAEDLLRHLDNVAATQADAAAALERSQHWTDRTAMTLPDCDPVATRRMQLARAALTAAAMENSRALEELEIVKRILIERSKKP